MRPTPCGCTSAPTNMYNRTQIFSTIGESVDAFCIPRQRVLPSPCAVTAIDGSVVTTQAARSPDSQTVLRVLAAMFFYGLIQWLAVQSDPRPAPLFAHFFWQDRKSMPAERRPRPRRTNGTPVKPDKRADAHIGPYKHIRNLIWADCTRKGYAAFNGPCAFGSETAKYQWTILGRCAIIFAKINHKHSLIQRYRKEDQYGGNQGKLRR